MTVTLLRGILGVFTAGLVALLGRMARVYSAAGHISNEDAPAGSKNSHTSSCAAADSSTVPLSSFASASSEWEGYPSASLPDPGTERHSVEVQGDVLRENLSSDVQPLIGRRWPEEGRANEVRRLLHHVTLAANHTPLPKQTDVIKFIRRRK